MKGETWPHEQHVIIYVFFKHKVWSNMAQQAQHDKWLTRYGCRLGCKPRFILDPPFTPFTQWMPPKNNSLGDGNGELTTCRGIDEQICKFPWWYILIIPYHGNPKKTWKPSFLEVILFWPIHLGPPKPFITFWRGVQRYI